MKVYTKKGDEGKTSRYDGKIVHKDDPWIILVSKVDALQGSLDLAFDTIKDKSILPIIDHIQDKLWQTAGELSLGKPGKQVKREITHEDTEILEKHIDKFDKKKEYFVRFRGESASRLNDARLKCRELEVYMTQFLKKKQIRPEVYKYINRLSDLLYVLACHEMKDRNQNGDNNGT